MGKRTFDVDAEAVLPDGFWPDGPPIDLEDRTALDQFMLDMSSVLDRIGGTLSVIALRQEVAPEMFVPIGFRAQWSSYAPAQRMPREEAQPLQEAPAPEPAPEPEPEDIGPDPEPQQAAETDESDESDPFDDDFGPDAEAALAAAATGG